jgi:SAM-dependent methyltransferase
MDSAAAYAARVDAVNALRARLAGRQRPETERWDAAASRFKMDPRRPLDANHAVIAEYIRPDDIVLDVGGGAGRVSLPLALRCREVINVEPSPGMCAAFEASAREAGIGNARVVQSEWPAAGVEGDVTLVFNVTYFIREIVPFIEGLVRATRRRVIVGAWSVPPPAHNLPLYPLIHGIEGEAVPGHRELLPVLWDMGILPEVRVLPNDFVPTGALPQTPDEAVAGLLQGMEAEGNEEARQRLHAAFDSLFRKTDRGYVALWRPSAREMLITWETRTQPTAA